MNEKRIQEVIEIERQAQGILESAKQEAERLPLEAEREGRELIEKVRASARDEARKLVDQARAEDQVARIVSEAEARVREAEKLGLKNFDRAVAYVLDRVIGKA